MKPIRAVIKKMTPYQTLGLIAFVLLTSAYFFFQWVGEVLRTHGDIRVAILFGIPIALTFMFSSYKDKLDRE